MLVICNNNNNNNNNNHKQQQQPEDCFLISILTKTAIKYLIITSIILIIQYNNCKNLIRKEEDSSII